MKLGEGCSIIMDNRWLSIAFIEILWVNKHWFILDFFKIINENESIIEFYMIGNNND